MVTLIIEFLDNLLVRIFGTFPRVIQELVEEFDIFKLKLSLARGLWNLEDWGESPISSLPSTGISLQTWLSLSSNFDSLNPKVKGNYNEKMDENEMEMENEINNGNDNPLGLIDKKWELLCQQLSGLFCGSINLINSSKTVIPQEIFPEAKRFHGKAFRMALLPRETVCTENLTPWLKLLPCKGQAGLASLLNPLMIFEAAHLLMNIEINTNERDGIILTQKLMITMDMKRWNRTLSWSFKSLFNRTVESVCPLAESSKIMTFLPPPQHLDWQLMERSNNPIYDSTTHAIYDTKNIIGKNVGIVINSSYSNLNPSRISVDRRLRGGGKDLATLYIKWTNLTDKPLHVKHLDMIPWFLQIYTHTLKFKRNGNEIGNQEKGNGEGGTIFMPYISILPCHLKIRSTQMEIIFTLAPKDSLIMTMECMKKFLQFIDFPFDPNRGLDIPGAIVQYHDNENGNGNDNKNDSSSFKYEFTTPTILMTIPTPDFTMTYNIITLSSTILSIFYGAFFNFTYRRFYRITDVQNNLITRIKNQLLKGVYYLKLKLKKD